MNTRIVSRYCYRGDPVAAYRARRNVKRALRKYARLLARGELGAAARMPRRGVRSLLVLMEAQDAKRAVDAARADMDRMAYDAAREDSEDRELVAVLMGAPTDLTEDLTEDRTEPEE